MRPSIAGATLILTVFAGPGLAACAIASQTAQESAVKTVTPSNPVPATLPRVPLPKITVPKSDPAHPANQPLDETQKEILRGVHGLTASSHPEGPSIDTLPKTQGDAADHIRKRYQKHFGRK